jgi:hypothetical protein
VRLPGVGLGGGRRQSSCGEGKGREGKEKLGGEGIGEGRARSGQLFIEARSAKAEAKEQGEWKQPVGVLACPPVFVPQMAPMPKISLPKAPY